MRWSGLLISWMALACSGTIMGADMADLDQLIASVPPGGMVGIEVVNLADGGLVYRHLADEPLHLASVTKLLTCVAGLTELGLDYQFHTRFVALGPVSGGTISGLGVIGGGSPCLDVHFTAYHPERAMRAVITGLKAAGVVRIQGDIVVDHAAFSGPIRPATYPQDAYNQERWYSAPASAFAWNDNCIEVRVLPTSPGSPCTIEVRPRSARIAIHNHTHMEAGVDRIAITRAVAGNDITVSGSCGKASAWFPLAIHDQPDLLAGDELKAELIDAGIAVDGVVRAGSVDPGGTPIADIADDLVSAVRVMDQRSQNFYAEQLLRVIGLHASQEGSISAGVQGVLGALRTRLGADALGSVSLLDGSGLSYGNRASAGFLIHLLTVMASEDAFTRSLKIQWFGKIKGLVKTGSLAVASNLAGYLALPSGAGRHAFAILVNQGTARDFSWGAPLRNRLIRALAKDLSP